MGFLRCLVAFFLFFGGECMGFLRGVLELLYSARGMFGRYKGCFWDFQQYLSGFVVGV